MRYIYLVFGVRSGILCGLLTGVLDFTVVCACLFSIKTVSFVQVVIGECYREITCVNLQTTQILDIHMYMRKQNVCYVNTCTRHFAEISFSESTDTWGQ